MPDLTPSALAALCDALRAGQLGTLYAGQWLAFDPERLTITAGTEVVSLASIGRECRDVWHFRAPGWALPALDGLPCEMPATATEPEPDDRQGDFWRTT